MQGGDAFRVSRNTRFKDRHVYFVLSDPQQDPTTVVIANLTSYGPGEDDSCILEVGAHRVITHRSCIRYGSASLRSVEKINEAMQDGLLEKPPPASPRMLARMREGAGRSMRLSQECRDFLEAQGLVRAISDPL